MLARTVTERLVGPEKEMTVRASPQDGRLLAWIDRHAEVIERGLVDGELVQRIRMPERLAAEIQRLAAHRVEVTTDGGKAAMRSIRRDEETPR